MISIAFRLLNDCVRTASMRGQALVPSANRSLLRAAGAWLAMIGLSAGGELKFEPDTEFLRKQAGSRLGACSAVAVNSKQQLYLFHRGPAPVMRLDLEGKLLDSWGDQWIKKAHGLRLDAEENVWVTDVGSHRVLKFSPDGKLLLTLGDGTAGDEPRRFNQPTDIAFGPKGEVYISDGYGNSRVVQYTQEGKFVTLWGRRGAQPGEFNLPHAILFHQDELLLVGDRENNRIQIFELNGQLKGVRAGFAPYGLAQDKEGRVYIADGRAHRILILSAAGQELLTFGGPGAGAGQFNMPHMLCLDAAGNLYVAEVGGERVQKFLKK